MTTEQQQQPTMTGSPQRRRSTFYIPLQATARPILAVARLVDAAEQIKPAVVAQPAASRHQKLVGVGGRALSASALALLQADHPPSQHRPPASSSPSSSRRSSPLAFIRRPSSRKLARSSSTIITTGGRWLSSKATAPLRINCSDSSSSFGGDMSVVQQANRSPPIIVIEGSPDEFYRRRRRRRRRRRVTGEEDDRSFVDDANDSTDDDGDDDNQSGRCEQQVLREGGRYLIVPQKKNVLTAILDVSFIHSNRLKIYQNKVQGGSGICRRRRCDVTIFVYVAMWASRVCVCICICNGKINQRR